MSKQRLLFITTGGTIASVRTAQGAQACSDQRGAAGPSAGIAAALLPGNAQPVQHRQHRPRQEHWLMMARAIQENYALYDGFIICHGTDTLAYSAAALSYLIQNADKPIILTGAQQPISNEITDARKTCATA